MTTAHRATWKAMRGGLQEEGSFSLHVPSAGVSSKDAPTEPTLKTRARPQDTDVSRDKLRSRIESAEVPDGRVKKRARSRFATDVAVSSAQFHVEHDDEIQAIESSPAQLEHPDKANTRDDADPHRDGSNEADSDDEAAAIAAGSVMVRRANDNDNDNDNSDDSDSDSDSSEDEAELLAEVERLRQERAAAREQAEVEACERAETLSQREAAAANPLLGDLGRGCDDVSDTASVGTGSVATGSVATGASLAYAVRRRWDDDVVFRGQGGGERRTKPRFLNDTIRNDFHRRFMKKYMR